MKLTLQSARPTQAGVEYSVWAPLHENVAVEAGNRKIPLINGGGGFFHGIDEQGKAGDLYKFNLSGKETLPDAAAHFLPEGVHGPAEVIDHMAFQWAASEREFRRPAVSELIIYEMHVGTFTKEGTFRSAIERL